MVFEIVLNIIYALCGIFISVIFWLKDTNKGILRIAISIHSLLLLITLVSAMYIGLELHIYNNSLIIIIFYALFILSIISIALSFGFFTGHRLLLLLHLWNLFALVVTFFIGAMSLTNDWL